MIWLNTAKSDNGKALKVSALSPSPQELESDPFGPVTFGKPRKAAWLDYYPIHVCREPTGSQLARPAEVLDVHALDQLKNWSMRESAEAFLARVLSCNFHRNKWGAIFKRCIHFSIIHQWLNQEISLNHWLQIKIQSYEINTKMNPKYLRYELWHLMLHSPMHQADSVTLHLTLSY